MNRIPSIVRKNSSYRSLVSQITFDDESLISESDVSESSSIKPETKWSSGTDLKTSRKSSLADTVPSSQPVPMPERKCSTPRLFDLPVEDLRNQALQQALLGCQQPNKAKGGAKLIDQFLSAKRSPTRQSYQGSSSRGRMANAKWDLTPASSKSGSTGRRNSKWDSSDHDPSTGPSLSSLLSSFGSSTDSSGDGRRTRRPSAHSNMTTSFSRISMDGTLEFSSPRKPTRMRSKDGFTSASNNSIPTMSPSSSSSSWSNMKKKNSFASSRSRPSTHSTMPLTMPVRKTSIQNLMNLTSGSSSNALRKKLSRSKLQNSGAYNPMVPRRIGSASSMVRIQSRDHLRRHG